MSIIWSRCNMTTMLCLLSAYCYKHDAHVSPACRSGIVTKVMLDTPKKMFLVIGALEAAAQILGFIGAAKLPGQIADSARLPHP